ncbi:MAG: esterase family protein [Hyphomicrobiales bacterium]|nr:esterase family protein [Hyphomicrobiales bacterium]
MAKLVSPLLAALLVIWTASAHAGSVKTDQSVFSEALDGQMRYSIYLPDAYHTDPEDRFPVVYLLHGYGANNNEWLEFGHAGDVLDRLIGSGQIPPFIAVMPFAEKSWYVDSAEIGGPGNYETAIVRDLPAKIDEAYRTISARSGRYVAGLSMGGYGAMRFAFFHPGRYRAAASLSGALFRDIGIPSIDAPIEEGDAVTQEKAEFWFQGAYGRPFDAGVYRDRSPFGRVNALSEHAEQPEILIMSGDDDYFRFYEGSADLYAAMRRATLPAELRIENGGHDWELWREQFPRVMRFFAEALVRGRNGGGH